MRMLLSTLLTTFRYEIAAQICHANHLTAGNSYFHSVASVRVDLTIFLSVDFALLERNTELRSVTGVAFNCN